MQILHAFFHGSVLTLLRFLLTVVLGLRCTLKRVRSVWLCHWRLHQRRKNTCGWTQVRWMIHPRYIQDVSSRRRWGWSAFLVWACLCAPGLQETWFVLINVKNRKIFVMTNFWETVGTTLWKRSDFSVIAFFGMLRPRCVLLKSHLFCARFLNFLQEQDNSPKRKFLGSISRGRPKVILGNCRRTARRTPAISTWHCWCKKLVNPTTGKPDFVHPNWQTN